MRNWAAFASHTGMDEPAARARRVFLVRVSHSFGPGRIVFSGDDLKAVAGTGVASFDGAGRQLDDGEGAPGRRNPAAFHVRAHLEHAAVFRQEQHVDREAHLEVWIALVGAMMIALPSARPS